MDEEIADAEVVDDSSLDDLCKALGEGPDVRDVLPDSVLDAMAAPAPARPAEPKPKRRRVSKAKAKVVASKRNRKCLDRAKCYLAPKEGGQ